MKKQILFLVLLFIVLFQGVAFGFPQICTTDKGCDCSTVVCSVPQAQDFIERKIINERSTIGNGDDEVPLNGTAKPPNGYVYIYGIDYYNLSSVFTYPSNKLLPVVDGKQVALEYKIPGFVDSGSAPSTYNGDHILSFRKYWLDIDTPVFDIGEKNSYEINLMPVDLVIVPRSDAISNDNGFRFSLAMDLVQDPVAFTTYYDYLFPKKDFPYYKQQKALYDIIRKEACNTTVNISADKKTEYHSYFSVYTVDKEASGFFAGTKYKNEYSVQFYNALRACFLYSGKVPRDKINDGQLILSTLNTKIDNTVATIDAINMALEKNYNCDEVRRRSTDPIAGTQYAASTLSFIGPSRYATAGYREVYLPFRNMSKSFDAFEGISALVQGSQIQLAPGAQAFSTVGVSGVSKIQGVKVFKVARDTYVFREAATGRMISVAARTKAALINVVKNSKVARELTIGGDGLLLWGTGADLEAGSIAGRELAALAAESKNARAILQGTDAATRAEIEAALNEIDDVVRTVRANPSAIEPARFKNLKIANGAKSNRQLFDNLARRIQTAMSKVPKLSSGMVKGVNFARTLGKVFFWVGIVSEIKSYFGEEIILKDAGDFDVPTIYKGNQESGKYSMVISIDEKNPETFVLDPRAERNVLQLKKARDAAQADSTIVGKILNALSIVNSFYETTDDMFKSGEYVNDVTAHLFQNKNGVYVPVGVDTCMLDNQTRQYKCNVNTAGIPNGDYKVVLFSKFEPLTFAFSSSKLDDSFNAAQCNYAGGSNECQFITEKFSDGQARAGLTLSLQNVLCDSPQVLKELKNVWTTYGVEVNESWKQNKLKGAAFAVLGALGSTISTPVTALAVLSANRSVEEKIASLSISDYSPIAISYGLPIVKTFTVTGNDPGIELEDKSDIKFLDNLGEVTFAPRELIAGKDSSFTVKFVLNSGNDLSGLGTKPKVTFFLQKEAVDERTQIAGPYELSELEKTFTFNIKANPGRYKVVADLVIPALNVSIISDGFLLVSPEGEPLLKVEDAQKEAVGYVVFNVNEARWSELGWDVNKDLSKTKVVLYKSSSCAGDVLASTDDGNIFFYNKQIIVNNLIMSTTENKSYCGLFTFTHSEKGVQPQKQGTIVVQNNDPDWIPGRILKDEYVNKQGKP